MFSLRAFHLTTKTTGVTSGKSARDQHCIKASLTCTFSILWVYIVFNIFAALVLYYLVRMPKPKKQKEGKQPAGANNQTAPEEPSPAGSGYNSDSARQGEKQDDNARYASITGTSTPPVQPKELSEKA